MRLAPSPAAAVVVLGAYVLTAAGFDPATDSRCRERGICLSSFIWCSADEAGDCTYPPNGGAISHGADFGVLYATEDYNITWRQADHDLPVLIEWSSQPADSTEEHASSSTSNVIWSKNVTADEPFVFRAGAIFDELPTGQGLNATREEIMIGAQNVLNTIRISQPGSDEEGFASSSQFAVLPHWTKYQVRSLEEEHRDELQSMERRWQIGVGVGVGVGVPLLMAATWFVARRGRPQKLGGHS